jgi:hypoxanthine phosphoribosyltransferase
MRLSSNILIDERQLKLRVEAMAAAIAADTPEDITLSVLVLMDGAFMFCAELVRLLPMPVRLAFVPMVSVGRGGDPSAITLPADFPVKGADLLVVEDILDTGKTLVGLKAVLAGLGPQRTRFAVLLDKPARRAIELEPDYVGFTIPDKWVVGYGLDADGLYRNLPYISYVEEI